MYSSTVCISGVYFGSGECVLGKKASMQSTAKAALRDVRLLQLIAMRISQI